VTNPQISKSITGQKKMSKARIIRLRRCRKTYRRNMPWIWVRLSNIVSS